MVTSCTTDAAQTPVIRIGHVSSAEGQMAPLPAKRFRTPNVRLADFQYEGPSARSGFIKYRPIYQFVKAVEVCSGAVG